MRDAAGNETGRTGREPSPRERDTRATDAEELPEHELREEDGQPLPNREGTFNALADQATLEQHPEANDETTSKGGLDV